jgi:hypothetical protein
VGKFANLIPRHAFTLEKASKSDWQHLIYEDERKLHIQQNLLPWLAE